ncbi:MAG: hypothetical protein ACRDOO_00435 [Actinomadura sp.]
MAARRAFGRMRTRISLGRISLGALALVLLATGAAAVMLSCDQQRTGAAPLASVIPTPVVTGAPAVATSAATKIFAVIKPAGDPAHVLVARATERRPGGPETLVPVRVQPYAALSLAPGAIIRITAPLYPGNLTDWVTGAQVTPEQFTADARQAEARYGPLPDRARMFYLWLDPQGRVIRMQHYFTP